MEVLTEGSGQVVEEPLQSFAMLFHVGVKLPDRKRTAGCTSRRVDHHRGLIEGKEAARRQASDLSDKSLGAERGAIPGILVDARRIDGDLLEEFQQGSERAGRDACHFIDIDLVESVRISSDA